jgi:predicted anti-sigma-YlaC factor YlaD
MTCQEAGKVLQAYLDHELDDLTTRRVREHLAVCVRCGLDRTSYAEIKAALARRGSAEDHEQARRRLQRFAEELASDAGDRRDDRREPPGSA